MGEHLGKDDFRLVDMTIQLRGGAFASFVRLLELIAEPLRNFFDSTEHQYTRYNYLGEWHSHPSFALNPSGTDVETMEGIVGDIHVGANFVVLLLTRLTDDAVPQMSLTVFLRDGRRYPGEVVHQ